MRLDLERLVCWRRELATSAREGVWVRVWGADALPPNLRLWAYRRYRALCRKAADRAAIWRLRRHSAISPPIHGTRFLTTGHGAVIGPGCRFEGEVGIGAFSTVSPDCHFSGTITVGRYTQFGPKCVVVASDHPTDTMTPYSNARLFEGRLKALHRDAPVTIGDGVLVGASSVILPGSAIGRGTIIGAGSIVRGPCRPYGLYAGNPARLVRMRLSPEHIERIERSRWWERDPRELGDLESMFFDRSHSTEAEPEGSRKPPFGDPTAHEDG